MKRAAQARVLAPRKRPVQRRSRETFDALVEACAWLLAERGYARTTTNHVAERAGVNIASLYEYFPGKDAIVAEVCERLVRRVLDRLAEGAERVTRGPAAGSMRRWIEWIHDTIGREKKLAGVFLYQVPYTQELESTRAIGGELLALSQRVRGHAGGFLRGDVSDATLHLAINLVVSTIMQLVFDPPREVSRRAMLDELAFRLEEWLWDGPRAAAR